MAIMSLDSNKTSTKTENGTRDWNVPAIALTMFLFGGIWNTLRLGTRKSRGYFKLDLMGLTPKSMEGRGAKGTQTVMI